MGLAIRLLVVFYFCVRKKNEECSIAKLTVYYDHNVAMPKQRAKGQTGTER